MISKRNVISLASIVMALFMTSLSIRGEEPGRAIRIGSKKFTESVILAELAAQLGEAAGTNVSLRQELGGTRMLWDALTAGEIDLYPEYTGTIAREIFREKTVDNDAALERMLSEKKIQMSRPLGFSNRYAIGMLRQKAEQVGIRTISDLAQRPMLRFGLSDEFLNRADGWPGLLSRYGLAGSYVRGLDHDLAYKGLADGSIDVIDLYTTDPEIHYYNIRVLDDDRGYFSDNKAVLLYRADLRQRASNALKSILRLEGSVDNQAMIAMSGAVKTGRRTERDVAAQYLAVNFGILAREQPQGVASRILERTKEHLWLTSLSLSAAILISIPLGVIAAKHVVLGHTILAAVGVMQTIPSLALLVFMIPVLGIGAPPAIAALSFYSLLPIVRNTALGLTNIPPAIRNSAIALGLTPAQSLWLVELPMASPAILDGMKTAAVINIGTATLGALIGAGGYGQPIFTGVRLDDFGLILEGALPAAVLALLVQAAFELAERYLVPKGLRLKPNLSL
jgi:osmoprotectant transport system permease protein